jgi:hypothetical protein
VSVDVASSNLGTFEYTYEVADTEKLLKGDIFSRWIGNREFCALTGEMKQLIDTGSVNLVENIDAAKKIVNYVQGIILNSGNHPYRTKSLKQQKDRPDINSRIRNISHKISRIRMSSESDLEVLKRAKEQKVANCSEMVELGFEYALSTLHTTSSIEIFHIHGGDHVFLVIGRDPNSDMSDSSTWGTDCVICDPWSGAYYPALKLKNYLLNFKKLQLSDKGILECSVDSFDPKTQQLGSHPPKRLDVWRREQPMMFFNWWECQSFHEKYFSLLEMLESNQLGLYEELISLSSYRLEFIIRLSLVFLLCLSQIKAMVIKTALYPLLDVTLPFLNIVCNYLPDIDKKLLYLMASIFVFRFAHFSMQKS